MSNPGVIELSSKKLMNGSVLRIEDNLGESIHFHYDDFRIDLTVKEYLDICSVVKGTINELINIEGFDVKYFDPVFLDMISLYLKDLKKCEIQTIQLKDLIVQTEGFLGLPKMRGIEHSRVVKAIDGDTAELERYRQENNLLESNVDRVNQMYDMLSRYEYPVDDKYIVLFNNENYIRDGQHRAACLYKQYGLEKEIPIIRLYFKDNKHNVPKFMKLRYVKLCIYEFAKKVYKYLRANYRRYKYKQRLMRGN